MLALSNNEYILLSLIWQAKSASGYQLNAAIEDMGYREWAEIGMTSIYTILKKLEQKGLIDSHIAVNKTTQGPIAKEYSLTDNGTSLLKEDTEKGLSETRERDRRFDMALSVIDIISSKDALTLIGERKKFLAAQHRRLSDICTGQNQTISFKGALLFRHTLRFIQSEIAFLEELIGQWKEMPYDHR